MAEKILGHNTIPNHHQNIWQWKVWCNLAATFVCMCTEKFMSCLLHSYLKALVITLLFALCSFLQTSRKSTLQAENAFTPTRQ